MRPRPAWFVLFALACGDGRQEIHINSGSLRLSSEAGVLRAEVELLHCLSSGCYELVASACTIRETDGALKVTSRIVLDPGDEARCGDDCGSWTARCETLEPEPGEYVLLFGGARTPLAFPLSEAVRVLPDGSVAPSRER